MHPSIGSQWYGNNMCGGTVAIANRAALYAAVAVGDVLILPSPNLPQHSLVVVSKSSWFGHQFVYVRGFNNHGTLGTGQQNAYDDGDRDIDVARYWHNSPVAPLVDAVVNQHFGQAYNAGGPLLRIPYATYSQSAATLRNRCNGAGAAMVYVAPP